MSETTDIFVQVKPFQNVKIIDNGDLKPEVNTGDKTEFVSGKCNNQKKDVKKKKEKSTRNSKKYGAVNGNRSMHKKKAKLSGANAADNEEQSGILENGVGFAETKQNGENASSKNEEDTTVLSNSKKLTKKSQDINCEIEGEDYNVKVKSKFRLSLNSEVKSKNKFKEYSNQGSIKSFFQKLSPGTQDSNKNIQKDMKASSTNIDRTSTIITEELQKKLKRIKNTEKLITNDSVGELADSVCIKNKKTNAKNISTLINGNQNSVKENSGHADKNSTTKESLDLADSKKKSKSSRSKKQLEKQEAKNRKEKVPITSNTKKEGKRLVVFNQMKEEVVSTNEVSLVHDETESDRDTKKEHLKDREHKKVRFSKDIKEFSPERIQKHSKFHKTVTDTANQKFEESVETEEETRTEVSENTVELIEDTKNHVEESSDSSESKVENRDKTTSEESKMKIRNAFAFMMDSRHKSIGQNLPGREQEKLEESPELNKEKKKKLSSRKAVLEEWANAKGAKKRKIEDEEKGIVIENKLKKRAKRLKKMLTEKERIDVVNGDSQDTGEIVVKKHKVTRIIESDSEHTCDSHVVLAVEEPEDSSNVSVCPKRSNHRKGKRKHKSSGEENDLPDDVTVVDDALDEEIFIKCKKPKLSISSNSSNSGSNANCEDNQKNSLKKSISSASMQQTELSSFFGILNKTEKSEVKNNGKSKLQMKRNVNNSEIISTPQHNKKKINSDKLKLSLKKNDDSNTAAILDDFSNSSAVIHNHSSKKIEEELDLELDIDECMKKDASALLTPSSIKQWKMKLKVSLANVPDEEIERLILSPKIRTESEDDEEDLQKMKTIAVGSDSDTDDEPLSSKKYYRKTIEKGKSKNIKPIKLAPLFIKAQPKPKPPKLDEATIEARIKFLHSDIPDSLKKAIVQQKRMEEVEYQIFPIVSHVTVKPTNEQLENSHINFWSLPKAEMQFANNELYLPKTNWLNLKAITSSTAVDKTEVNLQVPKKITNINNYLKQIKSENPNYPVYKTFKFLHHKHTRNNTEEKIIPEIVKPEVLPKKLKRGRPKKKKAPLDDVPIEISPKQPINTFRQEIWTDLYKPSTSEEMFGNHASISQFKTWLETWLEFSEEINIQQSMRKRRNSDSSDFESTDAESKDSIRLPGNTVIFCGPHGSGKTTAVYALCNELDINVLELNASSKRTGKRLLQELQEATQSHQVRKNDSNSLTAFLKKEETKTPQNSQSSDSQNSTSSKRMCLLLIEDIDVVFEQDENFITALGQLLTTSKRPVVLTTTDLNCLHLKKFVAQHRIITFSALSSKTLATWFQLLCLIEGLHVDRQAIVALMEWNKGDVRRTLLQLQFWVQSGGQSNTSKETFSKIMKTSKRFSCDEQLCKDDSSNISWLNVEESTIEEQAVVHSKCLESFGYSKKINYITLLPVDLGDVWWNIPNLLKMPSPLRYRSRADFKNSIEEKKNIVNENKNSDEGNNVVEDHCSQSSAVSPVLPVKQNEVVVNKMSSKHLQNVLNIFDTLAITDTVYEKLTVDCDLEPVHTNRNKRTVKNSLELSECMESYCWNRDCAYEWSHALLEGYVNVYNVDGSNNYEDFSILEDKRWRTKQNKCDEAFLGAVPTACHLDRNSVNVDYLSTLRTMARSEVIRASNNNKRRNRFYNYLRGVGINCNDSLFQTVCETFQHED